MGVNLNIGQQAQTADLTGATTTPGTFISSLLSGVMSIAALMVLLYFVWGAIEWITAGGDQSKIQKGRDRIVQSAIGIIVLASSVAIFIVLQQFLGISVIRFPKPSFGERDTAIGASGAASGAAAGAAAGAINGTNMPAATQDTSILDRLRGMRIPGGN